MSFPLDWHEIAVRLILTALAGSMIGLNRGGHGHPAGLRTTLLVCMAASLSMIQVNLLLGMAGKPADSFVTLDLMRLPLGILSGMGFIGAGVILKRDNVVLGITTAATLWFVTVLGLCFGGGQKALGLIGLGFGVAVLWGLKWVEMRLPVHRTADLVVKSVLDHEIEAQIQNIVKRASFETLDTNIAYDVAENRQEIRFELRWRSFPADTSRPKILIELSQMSGVLSVAWNPASRSGGLP